VYNQILFTNILRLLGEQRMSKHDLAIRANISDSFLSDLTNGKANPSLRVMESIAEALGSTLPFLLESNDLDQETLKELAGGKKIAKSLPDSYVRKAVILTEYQAFIVSQWEDANKKTIASLQKKRITPNTRKKIKSSEEKLEIDKIST
jgi:transcriptional regulator with XRE-family HTH domain